MTYNNKTFLPVSSGKQGIYSHTIACKNIECGLNVEKLILMKTWNVVEIFDTLDEKYKYWELLYYIVQEHMPTKKMRFRKTDRPCITSEWTVPPHPPSSLDVCLGKYLCISPVRFSV